MRVCCPESHYGKQDAVVRFTDTDRIPTVLVRLKAHFTE